jgi:hypothetical protein
MLSHERLNGRAHGIGVSVVQVARRVAAESTVAWGKRRDATSSGISESVAPDAWEISRNNGLPTREPLFIYPLVFLTLVVSSPHKALKFDYPTSLCAPAPLRFVFRKLAFSRELQVDPLSLRLICYLSQLVTGRFHEC